MDRATIHPMYYDVKWCSGVLRACPKIELALWDEPEHKQATFVYEKATCTLVEGGGCVQGGCTRSCVY